MIIELRNVKNGFKRLWSDTKFMYGYRKDHLTAKYSKEDVLEKQKLRQVQLDVMKFIPFSLFIIVPGLELLLPPFLVIFPNSVPSQFMSE